MGGFFLSAFDIQMNNWSLPTPVTVEAMIGASVLNCYLEAVHHQPRENGLIKTRGWVDS